MALGYSQYQTKLWKTRALLALLIAACGLVGWSVVERFAVEREMAARRAVVEAEYAALKERHAELQEDVEYLTDERSLEAEIRKHFDVAREGESVVVISGEPVDLALESTATSTVPNSSWWQFWR